MMKTVQLKIENMFCTHCQETIENALKRKNGIVCAEVNYRTGNAKITYDEKIVGIEEIVSVIAKLDYIVIAESSEKRNYLKNIFILFAIILIYEILNTLGLLNTLAPGQLADKNMSYGMLFIIGLFTSVHCIAMCGGINLSQSLSSRKDKGTFFKSSLFYNLGRLISYTIFGFILGLAGFIFGGILVVVMGFTMISQGTILGGFTFTKISFQRIQIDAEAVTEGNVQTVSTELQRGTYPNIKVKSGIPVKWIINAPKGSINGCNNRFLIQEYGIEHSFHTGENIIEFTPVSSGKIQYSCWMGMITGNIIVED